MAVKETTTVSGSEMRNLGGWISERIAEWSGSCGRFLDWEREQLILREPSVTDLAEHKLALRWLLQIYLTVPRRRFRSGVSRSFGGQGVAWPSASTGVLVADVPRGTAEGGSAEVACGSLSRINAELEAILESCDAFKEARHSGAQANDLYAIYDSRLEHVLRRQPSLSKETLQRMDSYGPWRRAQLKPPAMPPRA